MSTTIDELRAERIVLTDYLGYETEHVATSKTERQRIVNAALHANVPDPRDHGGARLNTARRKSMYVRCESIRTQPDGTETRWCVWQLAEPIKPATVPAPALDDAAALAELARLLPGMAGVIA